MIVLDFGSGNTCKNSKTLIEEMINQLSVVDKERKCIIKWQLFLSAGENVPLTKRSFDFAYTYAKKLRFKTTASVFDKPSLDFLLEFDIPFVKIANMAGLYPLSNDVPTSIPVIYSWKDNRQFEFLKRKSLQGMCCISKYPATIEDYENAFNPNELSRGISDHTIDWKLYKKYCPDIYEVHYKLYNNTGLDSGPFARTPYQLKEILK